MVTATADTDRLERIVEEAINKGELDVVDEVLASDYTLNGPLAAALPGEIRGPEGFKEVVRMWRAAFPDIHMTVEQQYVDGNTVIHQFEIQGTHEGEYMGIEPTGNEFEVAIVGFHTMEDGELVADYGIIDTYGLLQQLGVVEAPGS